MSRPMAGVRQGVSASLRKPLTKVITQREIQAFYGVEAALDALALAFRSRLEDGAVFEQGVCGLPAEEFLQYRGIYQSAPRRTMKALKRGVGK